jgi:hypothetical protein
MPARRLALSITAEGPVGGDRILAANSSILTDILCMKSSDSSDLARMAVDSARRLHGFSSSTAGGRRSCRSSMKPGRLTGVHGWNSQRGTRPRMNASA